MERILVFGMTDNPGGVESVIMNYYRNINREKIQFDFLCNYSRMAYEEEVKQLGGKIIYITPRREHMRNFKKELDEFMKKNALKYKSIWVNLCSLVNIDYLIVAKKYGIPKRIIHCHNCDNDGGKIKWLIHQFNKSRLSRYATDFWSCSENASRWFYDETIVKSIKYKVIPNAINIERFKFSPVIRQEVRDNYHLNDKVVIGHVGRFHFQKNHMYLIDVFEQLVKKNPNFHLLLVGQGELENRIKEMAKNKGIEQSITFVGATNHVEKLYQAMDIFTLPSIFEGLGIVALEAEANGLPCVFSDAIPKEVKINQNVFFLPLSNEKSEWCKQFEKLSLLERESPMNIENSIFNIKNQIRNFENMIGD